MNYRVDAGDLTGAQAAYEALQSEEVLNNEDLPAINKYIRALCAARNDYYDRITSIISDLEERHKKLEADTVSVLSMMYLRRGEIDEADDLLQTQAYHYTADERQRLLNALISFCLDRNTSTVRAWDAYCITRDILDELSVKERTILMNEFFARGRSDMACHIFGHMRQHPLPDRRPVLDTYIQCFLGIASLRDREHLDMVHNMLKMDSTVEPNTKLYNSLILAYTECEDADRALEFWEDITNSTEGPSYKSLEIVFRACGRKPFGDKVARRIWNKMRSMEIEVTKEVFASYIAALAGQGKFEEARDMVGVGEKELAIKVDVNL
jgi:tetratricopeptide (TPR) repeat protein